MNVTEAIRTMHRNSGLEYERISMLAGFDVAFLERIMQKGTDMRVDDFCKIADVCGYTVCVRGKGSLMSIRYSNDKCKRRDDVCASDAARRIFELSDMGSLESLEKVSSEWNPSRSLFARGCMPKVTQLVSLCEMAGFSVTVRRFRESIALDSNAPEKDIEVVVSQGKPLAGTANDGVIQAQVGEAIGSKRYQSTSDARKRNDKSKTWRYTRSTAKKAAKSRMLPSGAELTIDEKFKEFIKRFS